MERVGGIIRCIFYDFFRVCKVPLAKADMRVERKSGGEVHVELTLCLIRIYVCFCSSYRYTLTRKLKFMRKLWLEYAKL